MVGVHGLLRESMHLCGAGQALGKGLYPARIKTVDDADGSLENSNCTRMSRLEYSDIPGGQEKTF